MCGCCVLGLVCRVPVLSMTPQKTFSTGEFNNAVEPLGWNYKNSPVCIPVDRIDFLSMNVYFSSGDGLCGHVHIEFSAVFSTEAFCRNSTLNHC